MSKRVLAMALAILAFFIFVGSPFQQASEAIAGVDDAIIAIVIAALAAMGITFSAAAGYGSLQEYVGDLIGEYASSRNMTPQQLFTGVQSGSNRLGQILMNNRFVQVVSLFGAWLVSKFGLSNNTTTNVVAGTAEWGGLVAYVMPFVFVKSNGDQYTYEVYRMSGSPVYLVMQSSVNSVVPNFMSKGSAQVQRIFYNSANGEIYEESPITLNYISRYDIYLAVGATYDFTNYPMVESLTAYTYQEINAALGGEVVEGGAPIDIITTTIDLPTDRNDFDDEGAVLDLDAPWGLGYDDITDVVIPGAITAGEDADITIDYQEEDQIAEQVEDTPSQVVSQEVNDYQSPELTDVFPFCIPFDIYAFFECLAADPEAPAFTWRFYIPGICDEEIEIDLAAFDSAARILRTMELLMFIVGLAFVTRDKFLRG